MDFRDINAKNDYVFIQSGRMFPSECTLLEGAISFSFDAYKSIAGKKLDTRAQYLAAFFYRNIIYLSAAYQMVRRGMIDPAGNNMRTVFETVVWQYAYLTDDAVYANFHEITALESEKLKLIAALSERKNTERSEKEKPDRYWSNTKERKLENLRRKYNFQKMMKSLYSKEVFEKFFFNQYWVLCQKSHSSVFGLNYNTPNLEGTTTMEKRPQEIKDMLVALLYLSAENLLCYLNCFSDFIDSDKVLEFTNKINRMIPPSLSLTPDTKELKFTMRFREI